MPKATKKGKASHKAIQPAPGIIAGVTSFLRNMAQGRVGHVVANITKFTKSGVMTMGSLTWYAVVTAMVVVFPIRRAVEMDLMMEEERQRQEQRFNPDAVLPSVPGLYAGGAGASNVPVTAHY